LDEQAMATAKLTFHVETDEPDRRLELLHENVKKFGTVFNTVAPGTQLSGVLRRKQPEMSES